MIFNNVRRTMVVSCNCKRGNSILVIGNFCQRAKIGMLMIKGSLLGFPSLASATGVYYYGVCVKQRGFIPLLHSAPSLSIQFFLSLHTALVLTVQKCSQISVRNFQYAFKVGLLSNSFDLLQRLLRRANYLINS